MKLSIQDIKEGIQVNKWVRFALSFGLWVLGILILIAENVRWENLVGVKTAAAIISIIAFVKMIYNYLAPSPSQNTVATGNPIVTQVAVGPNPVGPSNPHV